MPATHVFQNKILAASGKVPQVASNNGVGNQYPPPIDGVTYTAPISGLHHMFAVVLSSQYVFKKNYVCEHHNNYVSDPELY